MKYIIQHFSRQCTPHEPSAKPQIWVRNLLSWAMPLDANACTTNKPGGSPQNKVCKVNIDCE